jgi:hypothetical protein
MQCHQFESILENQDSNPLPELAIAHIAGCQSCSTLLADFDAIRGAASGLDSEGIAPSPNIWISLRNQLEAEGIIRHLPASGGDVRAAWWSVFQRPALAGAVLVLTLVAASLLTYHQTGSSELAARVQEQSAQESPVPGADTVFREEVLNVGNDSISGLRRQDSAVTDSIHRNLRIVDNFIAMCEKSVREQPDNPMAREYLYGAYQQKAELLATAMQDGTTEGIQ